MTTKQELECQVIDLKRDVETLLNTLARINNIINNDDDSSPHAVIGKIHGTISVAGINILTLGFDDYKVAAGVRPANEVFA
jgi:hypothetical protein